MLDEAPIVPRNIALQDQCIPVHVCVSLILREPDGAEMVSALEIVLETGEELEEAYDLLDGRICKIFVKGTTPA